MGTKLIVVIDYVDSVLDVITIILEDAGYNVISLTQPPSTPVSDSQPDLIILDIGHNNSHNKSFYESLKIYPATASIPVMLTSTCIGLDWVAAQWKADSFMSKPFDIDDFIAKIMQLL
jgi:DNA-binding response OmpR family regulator